MHESNLEKFYQFLPQYYKLISMFYSLKTQLLNKTLLPHLSCVGLGFSFQSAQQDCRSFFRVIYVGGPLKGPQLTTTADTLTPTRYCVLSLILFVN